MPFLIALGAFLIFMQFYTISQSESEWSDFKARCEERQGTPSRSRGAEHVCVKKENVIVIKELPKEEKSSKSWWQEQKDKASERNR